MKLNRSSLWMAVALIAGCNNAGFVSDAQRAGMRYYQEGKFADAAGAFRAAVRQQPQEYRAQYYLGASLDQLGQYQNALQAYKSALDVMQTTEAGRSDQAFREKVMDAIASDVARSADRDTEIQLLKDKAKKTNNGQDYVLLARIYRQLGDPDSAIAAYKKATLADSENPAIRQEFGLYLNQLGLKQQAAEQLQHGR
jgi:cytochrome c-type biogenesis protein CcmH/NrfG